MGPDVASGAVAEAAEGGQGPGVEDNRFEGEVEHGGVVSRGNRAEEHDSVLPAGVAAGGSFIEGVDRQVIMAAGNGQQGHDFGQAVAVGIGFDADGQGPSGGEAVEGADVLIEGVS